MARKFVVIRRVQFLSAIGLEMPKTHPHPCPLRWVEAQTQNAPDIITFAWQPKIGEGHTGLRRSHFGIIPSPHRFSRRAWLKGYFFVSQKLLVIRPFYWPQGDNDYWDDSHERLNIHVSMTFAHLIRPELPTDTTIRSADNRWIERQCGLIVRD